MRERKTFAERKITKSSDETKKKYFLVYEGEETEVKYFDAVIDLKQELGINPIIELKPLIRSYSETGWSNPKKILDRVIQNIEESQTEIITFETLFNRIIDYLREEKIITSSKSQANSIWSILSWYCKEILGKKITNTVENFEEVCAKLGECIEQKTNITNILADISSIIKNQKITYAEGFDKICLIVDRDRHSFVSNPNNNQFDYVLKTCEEKKFCFYLTNPCFEFWLLLHFDQVVNLDKDKLLENPKGTGKRRYAENQLRNIWTGYKKSDYDAHALVRDIDKAIENEKIFCEDIKQLECKVGSNIGLLFQELRRK